jgi:hypothetical protein
MPVTNPAATAFSAENGLAEQHELGGALVTRDARQQEAGAGLRHETEVHERQLEARLGRRIHEIAMQQHRRADADGRTADGRDERLLEGRDGAEELRDGRRVVLVRVLEEILEIVAGAEAVRVAQDQHGPHGRIGRGLQAVGERLVHGSGQRVALLGPVDVDVGDAIARRDLDRCGHGGLAVDSGSGWRGAGVGPAPAGYFSASFTASRPAWAQMPSCSPVAPLTPTAPMCSPPVVLIGRPPSNVTRPGTNAMPGTRCAISPSVFVGNGNIVDVFAFSCAISMLPRNEPSIRSKYLRLPPSSRIAMFIFQPSAVAFATQPAAIFFAVSSVRTVFFSCANAGAAKPRAGDHRGGDESLRVHGVSPWS